MAALTGTYIDSPFTGTNDYITPEIENHTVSHWPATHITSLQPGGGSAVTDNLPVDSLTWAVSGPHAHSYLLDFYYHIHIVPNPVALGNIATTVYANVEVWNAFLNQSELLGTIGETNTTSVELLDHPAPPTTFEINESRIYRVQVGSDGNPVVAAEFQFNFASEQPTLLVTGSRAIVMPYAHNWRLPVKDTLEQKTDILPAKDGTEQRVQLRTAPRRYLEYLYTVQGTDKQKIKSDLWQAQARTVVIPLFIDPCILDADVTPGSTTISVETSLYREFSTEEMLAIITDGINSEVFEIDPVKWVQSTLIVSTQPLTNGWSAGDKVFPARLARIGDSQLAPALTSDISEFVVRYEIIGDAGADGLLPSFDLYDGDNVSVYRPNWREPVSQSFTRALRRFDNGMADPVIDDYHDQQSTVTKQLYTISGRIPTRQMILWSLLGVTESRWEPTWEADITVTGEITAASVVMPVANAHHTAAFGPGREDVRIQLNDGTVFYRGISTIGAVDSTTENITIDSALGQTVYPEEISIVSYMQRTRSASNTVELTWYTPELMEVSYGIKGLPKEV